MARYGDLDALLENLKKQYGEELGWQGTVNMSDVGMMIEDAPTADVVPKSEVERLRDINSLLTEAGQEWQKRYENLAREIFEEIDTMIFGAIIPNDCVIISIAKLAELKKKYTEGEKDGCKQ